MPVETKQEGLTNIQTSPMTFWLCVDQLVCEADNPWKSWSYWLNGGLSLPQQTADASAALFVAIMTRGFVAS